MKTSKPIIGITGHKGHLGQKLVQRLLEDSISDDIVLLEYIDREHFYGDDDSGFSNMDIVYHLGAKKGNYHMIDGGALTDVQYNLEATWALCEHLRRAGCKPRIVYSSTFLAEAPSSSYALCKAHSENVLDLYSKLYDWQAIVLRLPHLYGGDIGALDQVVKDAKAGKMVWMGNKELTWPAIHIDKAVDFLIKFTDEDYMNEGPGKAPGYFQMSAHDMPDLDFFNIYKVGKVIMGDNPIKYVPVSNLYERMTMRDYFTIMQISKKRVALEAAIKQVEAKYALNEDRDEQGNIKPYEGMDYQ